MSGAVSLVEGEKGRPVGALTVPAQIGWNNPRTNHCRLSVRRKRGGSG